MLFYRKQKKQFKATGGRNAGVEILTMHLIFLFTDILAKTMNNLELEYRLKTRALKVKRQEQKFRNLF